MPSPPSDRASVNPSFRWRTILEIGVISVVIYIVLGAPGLPASLVRNIGDSTGNGVEGDAPVSNDVGTDKLESIVYPAENLTCSPHGYDVHVFATSPLVLYIDGFLSEREVEELVESSAPAYVPSTLFTSSQESIDPKIRLSEKALLPRSKTVQCIEARALALQGWPKDTFIERLWTQRYNVSGHYALHYDWSAANPRARRVSSFMVYLGDACDGGGTQFPRLPHPGRESQQWCEFIECGARSDAVAGEGVIFKPRKGSAVFWQNFDASGRGMRETLHAGMPVTKGQKIGLNIWSWYQAGHRMPPASERKPVARGEL